jgi:hypothetical protein
VCGTGSTVNCGLVEVQIGTVLLVRGSVSVGDWKYGKLGGGESADWFSGVGEC